MLTRPARLPATALPALTSARLGGLATAVPPLRVATDAIWDALRTLRGGRLPRVAGTEGAQTRYLAAPLDWIMQPHSQSERTDAYVDHARSLALDVCAQALAAAGTDVRDIGLIICVSCTGFVLPSLDAELIPRLGLRADTVRLPITELGCGGGVAGLARAHDYLLAYPDRSALVVAVELPSLTFQPDDLSIDNMVAALVFGDGAGAAVVSPSPAPPKAAGVESLVAPLRGAAKWAIARTRSVLIPEGASHLGYELRDGGLRVILSRELPQLIETHLAPAVRPFLDEEGITLSDLDEVVVHAGGPRIVDAVQRSLQLDPDRLETSIRVFADYGNVSSASIFFVLEALAQPAPGAEALTLAFGPGLSIEMARLHAQA